MSMEKLYALKGEIVARGVKAITGLEMPVFAKRRFQHGALPIEKLRQRLKDDPVLIKHQKPRFMRRVGLEHHVSYIGVIG